ncbi:MAG TPA: chemotaxis protein CheB [Gemmatimonadales bacterium]|jgi:two-component system chemotaxis response regulator CheB|nr:chemotaxis protein CheB [Gemmatimonadales bacterium]
MAASAGGVDALGTILSGLPAWFPVPVAVVQHRSTHLPNMLAHVLGRYTTLCVKTAEAGEAPQPGTIYLAPPDRHLSITPDGTFGLADDGTLIHHTHSAADPLFLTAAEVHRDRVIAVVLTGGGDDGAEGARSVGLAGGVVLAQDEATSQVFSMPRATIATSHADAVLPLEAIGPALIRLVQTGSLGPSSSD